MSFSLEFIFLQEATSAVNLFVFKKGTNVISSEPPFVDWH